MKQSSLLPHLKAILLGDKFKNIWPFSLVVLLNFISALFEGISYAFILFAFGELSGPGAMASNSIPTSVTLFMDHFHFEKTFAFFLIIAVIMQIFRSVTAYLGQYACCVLGIHIQTISQKRIYEQILRLSFACVNRYKSGDLLEYAKMPADITMDIMNGLNGVIVSALMVLTSIGMMLYLSLPLTFAVILTFGTITLLQKQVIRKISTHSQTLLNHVIEFSKFTVQSINGLRAIHTFCREEASLKKIHSTLDRIGSSTRRITMWVNAIPSLNEMTGISLVAIFLILGQWILGSATTSLLLTFILILYRLNLRIQLFLTHLSNIAKKWGQVLRLEDILSESGKEFTSRQGTHFQQLKVSIEFRNVTLCYENSKDASIQDLNITIRKGETVAFVGSSGAGKSTVLDLMLRLYNPTGGSILIDGVHLDSYEIRSWRNQIGMVSQDTFIFNDTIEENIRFGKLDATLEEIKTAIKLADAEELIHRLPDGYQTVLGERGYRLSGGQKQKIALARALVRNPAILILDEATSNLDSQSEKSIQSAIEKFYGQKTIIIVAHRLSTIFHADQIVVLEKGRFVEIGSHDELLEKNGRYSYLWNIQFQKVEMDARK